MGSWKSPGNFFNQKSGNPEDYGYGASASRGVPVYVPAFAGTNLYCLVIEAHGCEQLAQGHCPISPPPGIELTTSESQVDRPSHYTSESRQSTVDSLRKLTSPNAGNAALPT